MVVDNDDYYFPSSVCPSTKHDRCCKQELWPRELPQASSNLKSVALLVHYLEELLDISPSIRRVVGVDSI